MIGLSIIVFLRRRTKGALQEEHWTQEGPYSEQYSDPDVVQPPLASASTLLIACSDLDIDFCIKESVLSYTT